MRPAAHGRVAALAFALIAVACGGESDPVDAGADAPIDSGSDGGPPDGGPVCAPGCDPTESCCGDEAGAPICVNVATDVNHCGTCNIDCMASGRGDSCNFSICACGDFDIGCLGRFTSTCCVSPDGSQTHCANLAQDPMDCGACGRECDPTRGNQCEGGRCVCGGNRGECAGTPEDTCCVDRFEFYDCIDTTSSRDHCGGCGNRCDTGLHCVASTCVPL